VEQAGGMAVSMDKRIMEIEPTELHQREPFFCGNSEMIEDLQGYLQKTE
jgi:fructose-1,6-bisphosphatase I